jgi:hypothetical protein
MTRWVNRILLFLNACALIIAFLYFGFHGIYLVDHGIEYKDLVTIILTAIAVLLAAVTLFSELGLGFSDEALPAGISGKLMRDSSSPAGFKLFTNEGDPPRRKRFTMAHEIGHYVLHRDLIGDGVVDNAMYRSSLSDDYERQADKFAGQLLLPAGAVRAAYRTTKSFAALSELFDASVDAIRIRLRELNLAP